MTIEAFIFVATISFLGMVSPGPDFFLVLKNSLSYSRKSALISCLGVIFSILVHMSYCVAGIAVLIKATPLLFNLLRYVGAGYLIWLGIKALRAKQSGTNYVCTNSSKSDLPCKTAFLQGFLCNLLNPKATLFFLAVFTQVLNTESSVSDKLWVAFIIFVEALMWWPFVVFVFQAQMVQRRYFKAQFFIDKLLGIILIALGVKVALGF